MFSQTSQLHIIILQCFRLFASSPCARPFLYDILDSGGYMSEGQLLAKLRRDAQRIAKCFKLRYLDLDVEPQRVRSRFGSCDEDRRIRVRLHNLRTGRFLQYQNLVHTLCHELAHVKYLNHSNEFKMLNERILGWARAKRIYRPKC